MTVLVRVVVGAVLLVVTAAMLVMSLRVWAPSAPLLTLPQPTAAAVDPAPVALWPGTCKAGLEHLESDPRLGQPFTPRHVHVFAFSNVGGWGLCALASSLQHFGQTLNVLGLDQSSTFFDGTSCNCSGNFGFQKKFWWMQYVLEQRVKAGIADDDLIMFLDGWDSVAQSSLSDVVQRYVQVMGGRRGVLFQGEKNCFPFDAFKPRGGGWQVFWGTKVCVQRSVAKAPEQVDGRELCDLMSGMAPTAGPYRWINSGGYLADPVSLVAFFRANRKTEELVKTDGDQTYAQLVQMLYPRIQIRVDSSASIWFAFQNFDAGDVPRVNRTTEACDPDYLMNGTAPRNALTGTSPMLLHFNGNGKPYQGSCSRAIVQRVAKKEHFLFDYDRQKRVPLGAMCGGEWK